MHAGDRRCPVCWSVGDEAGRVAPAGPQLVVDGRRPCWFRRATADLGAAEPASSLRRRDLCRRRGPARGIDRVYGGDKAGGDAGRAVACQLDLDPSGGRAGTACGGRRGGALDRRSSGVRAHEHRFVIDAAGVSVDRSTRGRAASRGGTWPTPSCAVVARDRVCGRRCGADHGVRQGPTVRSDGGEGGRAELAKAVPQLVFRPG